MSMSHFVLLTLNLYLIFSQREDEGIRKSTRSKSLGKSMVKLIEISIKDWKSQNFEIHGHKNIIAPSIFLWKSHVANNKWDFYFFSHTLFSYEVRISWTKKPPKNDPLRCIFQEQPQVTEWFGNLLSIPWPFFADFFPYLFNLEHLLVFFGTVVKEFARWIGACELDKLILFGSLSPRKKVRSTKAMSDLDPISLTPCVNFYFIL